MVHRAAPSSPPPAERLLAWMASLADPTRVRLVRLLERHELGVVELCDVLQKPQPTVSRHLKVLGDQGWVSSRRQGTGRLYRTVLDELDPAARKLWVLAREQTDGWPTVRQDQLRLDRVLRDRAVDRDAFFAGAAGEWDGLRRELYGDRFNLATLAALLPPTSVVADLGCGTGLLAAELAPAVARVVGVDDSPAMLRAARRRCAGLANVELLKGDLSAVPIDTASCDAAVCVLALTYVADPAAVVAELARVLRPGGRGVVVDLLPHDRDDFRRQTGQTARGLDPDAIARLMADAGLTDVTARPLPTEAGATGPALFLAAGTRGAGAK
jgi:ArsR family transcriptional regulator